MLCMCVLCFLCVCCVLCIVCMHACVCACSAGGQELTWTSSISLSLSLLDAGFISESKLTDSDSLKDLHFILFLDGLWTPGTLLPLPGLCLKAHSTVSLDFSMPARDQAHVLVLRKPAFYILSPCALRFLMGIFHLCFLTPLHSCSSINDL